MSDQLRWHRDEYEEGVSRAWAPKLNPADRLPPYYRLFKVGKEPVRSVTLLRPRAVSENGDGIDVGVGNTLKDAKRIAQEDYERRISDHDS